MNLLPRNSTSLERAIAEALAPKQAVEDGITLIGRVKFFTPTPPFLPFLAWEYGLSQLAPYLPNPYELINEGRDWTKLVGSTDAVDLGLFWLSYEATLDPAPPERVFWNSFQLYFSDLPPNDAPDLALIEGIASISVPRRSRFRRGVYGYDVSAAEMDWCRLDEVHLDVESGIRATDGTRFFPEAALWSFGRTHETLHLLTEAEGLAIGNWIEPPEGEEALWVDMDLPWVDVDVPWISSPEIIRRAAMAGWFEGKVLYLALRDGEGGIIGWRRCRAVRPVLQAFEGVYSFDGTRYDPSNVGTRVYVDFMTDVEDADGVTAAEMAIVVGATLAADVPPGRLWLEPDQIIDGEEIAVTAINVPLRKTVRDHFKFLVRF